MSRYSNLLVVIDPSQEQQPALSRAVTLSQRSDSTVKLTLFLAIYDFSYEMTSMLSSDERQAMRQGVMHQREEWMNEIIQSHNAQDCEIEKAVVWHNRPYEAIVERVLSHQHDLVVKATHKHDTLGSVIFTPTDWHLLRKCPNSVLLVKEHGWPDKGKIVASVHVASETETHAELNDKLVDEGNVMSAMLGAELHLANAYPATPVNITIELPDFDPSAYTDAVRGHHLTAMKALRQRHHIEETRTHVQEGLPEDVIPNIARELDAELVILGTTGRTGLSAVFIGNTAEHMIDQLDCDLLAIKPDGYISPLDPRAND
ncbi:universal stress protein UspE [Salinivibrio sp. IB643]|uniref:universal stress protein UspE n=1 Tax=Salinivibrio TaxID=51366 RepID=UPI0009893173|nr:universal stress protein UspE [Salinivibrio sp. IB643]OOE96286.1 universal stress protein UspE [Salinivibrio sp. IB643]